VLGIHVMMIAGRAWVLVQQRPFCRLADEKDERHVRPIFLLPRSRAAQLPHEKAPARRVHRGQRQLSYSRALRPTPAAIRFSLNIWRSSSRLAGECHIARGGGCSKSERVAGRAKWGAENFHNDHAWPGGSRCLATTMKRFARPT